MFKALLMALAGAGRSQHHHHHHHPRPPSPSSITTTTEERKKKSADLLHLSHLDLETLDFGVQLLEPAQVGLPEGGHLLLRGVPDHRQTVLVGLLAVHGAFLFFLQTERGSAQKNKNKNKKEILVQQKKHTHTHTALGQKSMTVCVCVFFFLRV